MSTFLIIVAVAMFVIGLAKAGLGSVLAIIVTPMLLTVLPADQVLGLLLPILIIADVFTLAALWGRWNKKLVVKLLPGGIAGVAVATFFLANISARGIRQGIGVIALLFVVYKLFEPRIRTAVYQPKSWHGPLAGFLSACASTLAHFGPPPVTIYLLMQKISPREFVATSALFFAALNWIKVPSYLYAGLIDFELLKQVIWLIPMLPLGVWTGKFIADKLNRIWFDRVITALLGFAGVWMLFW